MFRCYTSGIMSYIMCSSTSHQMTHGCGTSRIAPKGRSPKNLTAWKYLEGWPTSHLRDDIHKFAWVVCVPVGWRLVGWLATILVATINDIIFSLFFSLFLSSANEVSTGPTCQFLSVCLFVCLSVCVSGLFFKTFNWMIYWLLTVVLALYLSD